MATVGNAQVFQRESLLRMGLRHRHVLELYGLNDVVTGPNQYCQVTPWTKTPNGTLRDYVQQLHEEQANAPPALFEMVDTWVRLIHGFPLMRCIHRNSFTKSR